MIYRLLQPSDHEQFKRVFEKAFNRVPDLSNMTAIIGIKNEEIISFLCLYTVQVVDSMWIKPEYRQKKIWKELIDFIIDLPWKLGNGFYLFVGKNRESKIAKKYQKLNPNKNWKKFETWRFVKE